ncbi:MAG: hypothetical protein ACXWCG_09800 [Flavitalea sp.]
MQPIFIELTCHENDEKVYVNILHITAITTNPGDGAKIYCNGGHLNFRESTDEVFGLISSAKNIVNNLQPKSR